MEFFIRNGYKFKFNLNKTIRYFAEAQLGCPIAVVYTKKKIKKLLNKYRILSVDKDHIFPYNVKKYIEGKNSKRIIFKIMPNTIFKFLERHLGWHFLIKAKI